MRKQVLIFVAIILGLYVLYLNLFPPQGDSLVGKPAPLFEAEGPADSRVSLADLIGKKVILLNIWATWCAPCREEIPILNRIQREFDPQKFTIISLSEDDLKTIAEKVKALKNFEEEIPIDFPVYFDREGLIADSYGTFRIPETYLIARDGRVAYKHAGPITKFDTEALIAKIRGML